MPAIRDKQTGETLINKIRLFLNHPEGRNYLWVLVEGETDQKLYPKLIDGTYTKVESVPGGIVKLREALLALTAITRRVIGIRDADFLHLNAETETICQLFLTDVHDAEMMMVACDEVFKSLVSEHLTDKLAGFQALRTQILQSLVFLGGLRWLNNNENLELNFKGIDFTQFYEGKTLALNRIACLTTLENRSPNKKHSVNIEEIDALIENIDDYYNLCNGHDFEKAFGLHVTALKARGVNDEQVGSSLRQAYRKQDFSSTKLYSSLRNWQIQMGFKLFNCV